MVAAVEAIPESKANGSRLSRGFAPWSSALRDSCCSLLPSGDWSPAAAGTTPLVQNLYQGMLQDPVTGLYYERARWYSPSLGTWISQDPLSYAGGADAYQFVGSRPVGELDPLGLLETGGALPPVTQQLQDIQLLTNVLNGWYASGDLFAWRLLTAFLSNAFPSGHAGLTFEFAANEIKGDRLYREAAKSYFRWFVVARGPGTHLLAPHWPPARPAFNVEFYAEWGSDLMYALGGGHFGFTRGEVVVRKVCTALGPAYKWHTSGLEMVQRDDYTFPAGFLRTGFVGSFFFPVYGAAFDVQQAGFAKPF